MAPSLVTNIPFSEVRWNKFLPAYMWNNTYHLRRTKFVVYQICTMSLAAGSGLSNAAATKYSNRRDDVLEQNPTLSIDVDDIVAIRLVLTVIGGVLGLVFGTAMLWDLWWPERRESKAMSRGWKWSAMIGTIAQLAAAIAATAVVATGKIEIQGPDQRVVDDQLAAWPSSRYRESGNAIATVVLAWFCLAATAGSTGVMWKSYALGSKFGPFANCRRDWRRELTA